MDNIFNDWLVRYGFIYKKRSNKKNKDRFIKALITDILKYRSDIAIIEYGNDKVKPKNIYIGNIEKADKIVAAYFDTPSHYFGNYYFFDRKKQKKNTFYFILTSLLVSLIIGFLGLFAFLKFSNLSFNISSYITWIYICVFFIYFFILGKISKGMPTRKNIIRNTSSIITILMLLKSSKKNKTAFAFIDEGCYGDRSIDVIKSSCKKTAKIYCLDSIGAGEKLRYIRKDNITSIISSSYDKDNDLYFLSKKQLNKNKVNIQNIKTVIDYLK